MCISSHLSRAIGSQKDCISLELLSITFFAVTQNLKKPYVTFTLLYPEKIHTVMWSSDSLLWLSSSFLPFRHPPATSFYPYRVYNLTSRGKKGQCLMLTRAATNLPTTCRDCLAWHADQSRSDKTIQHIDTCRINFNCFDLTFGLFVGVNGFNILCKYIFPF